MFQLRFGPMGILIDRFETEEHTVVRYSRFLGGIAVFIAIMMVLLLVVKNFVVSILVYGIVMFVIRREMLPVRKELMAANDAGLLTRHGKRTSLRSPLTYYIAKTHQRPRRKGKPRGQGNRKA